MTISGILLEVNDYGLEFDSFLGAVYIRLLTTLVQLALLVPAVIGARAMWEWLKEDVRELTR